MLYLSECSVRSGGNLYGWPHAKDSLSVLLLEVGDGIDSAI